jgi:hypothetical protein
VGFDVSYVYVSEPNSAAGTGKPFTQTAVPTYRHPYFNGPYSMVGVTKDAGGTPHARRAYLLVYPSGICLGFQDTDTLTGTHGWYNMNRATSTESYCLLGLDNARSVNGGVHDEVVPA